MHAVVFSGVVYDTAESPINFLWIIISLQAACSAKAKHAVHKEVASVQVHYAANEYCLLTLVATEA